MHTKRLLSGLLLILIALVGFLTQVLTLKAADPLEPTFRKLEVRPSRASDTANALTVYDKSGASYIRIGPSNAALSYRTGGVLYTGVTQTITVLNTNATTNAVLIFKNGLLVNGP